MSDEKLKIIGEGLKIDKDYLNEILLAQKLGKIKLVVIGLDPFPTMATKIPFCKENWSDLKQDTGYRVFSSILDEGVLVGMSGTPKLKAIELAKQGIIFLNSSYLLLRTLKGLAREQAKSDAFNFNKHFIENTPAGAVICMGKAYTFTGKYMSDKSVLTKVFHAAAYPIHRSNRLWKNYWVVGELKRKFNLPKI